MNLRGHDLGRVSKYKSVRTECDGIIFDSKKEAARYAELKMLQKVGIIKDLKWQVKFPLLAAGNAGTGDFGIPITGDDYPSPIGFYVADFVYTSIESGRITVEDVKGVKTAVYQLKKKIFEANYGMRIVET